MISRRRAACTTIVLVATISLGLMSSDLLSRPAPHAVLQEGEPTLEALRAKAQERMRQDRSLFSEEQFREIETLYQQANKNLRTAEAKDILKQLVEKYPRANRAGCAVLYLAQMSALTERETYLKSAIASHGEAWYGDGVQVGALARAQLAAYYANSGRLDEAQALAEEVGAQFPGAVDHAGLRLDAALRKMNLLRAQQTQTRREPQFENSQVRAWKSIIMPNQPLPLHRHDHGRTIVALRGGTLDVVDGKGRTLRQVTWETGKAYWLDADPPGQHHSDLNRGTAPIEVIVVEMRK